MTDENTFSTVPAVASITTVYNGDRYFRAALRSLRSQTFDDLEIIVVVDGCPGRSASIAEEEAAEDRRIRVISLPHVGRSNALNIGIEASTAPYVAILDADDLAHRRRIEIQHRWLSHAPASVAAVGSAVIDFRGSGTQLPDPLSWEVGDREVTSELRRHNPLRHSSVLLRRDALDAVGGYDTDRRSQVDYDLYIRLCAEGYGIHEIDIPLVGIRHHGDQQFLGGSQLRYRLSSLAVQARAVRRLPGRVEGIGYLAARSGYLLARTVAPVLFRNRAGVSGTVTELEGSDRDMTSASS